MREDWVSSVTLGEFMYVSMRLDVSFTCEIVAIKPVSVSESYNQVLCD